MRAVPAAGAVADIGSGHGAVAAALAAQGCRVIATERTPSLLAALRADLSVYGVEVDTRGGEGLAPIAPGEVDVAVLAGMGGRRIVAILDAAGWLPRWLVLQPMQAAETVDTWVARRGFAPEVEEVVERGRRYRVFKVRAS